MRDKFTVSRAAARFHNAEDIQAGNLGDKYDITFFVSCYNEKEFIVATLDTVKTAMVGLDLTYDIVIIDDGSKDRSPGLIRDYIAAHPEIDIVFRQNARNKGWAQNYIDSTFLGKGRYHRAICGDNSEMVSTIRAVLKPLGEADIIIPYYIDVEHKPFFRHIVSNVYTTIVNLLSGNSLHYYNGLPIHRRYNVMRWHPDTRGFGFQAYILCLLLGQGATFKEVALSATERRAGSSNALTWRNLLSVAHTLSEIFLRRLSNRVHGRIGGGLAVPPERSAADLASGKVAPNSNRAG